MTFVKEVCQDPMKLFTPEELAALPDASRKELSKGKVKGLTLEQEQLLINKIAQFSETYAHDILAEPDYSKLAHLSGNLIYDAFKQCMANPETAEKIPAAVKVIFKGAEWMPAFAFNKFTESYFKQGLQAILAKKESMLHSSSSSTSAAAHHSTAFDADAHHKTYKWKLHGEIYDKLDQGAISQEEAVAKLHGLPAGTFFVRSPESGKLFVYVDQNNQIVECSIDDVDYHSLKIAFADLSGIVEEAYQGMIHYELPKKALKGQPPGTFLLRDSDGVLGVKIFNYVDSSGIVYEYRLTLKSEGFFDKSETAYQTLHTFYVAHSNVLKFPFKKSDMETFQSEQAKMPSAHSGQSHSVISSSSSSKPSVALVPGTLNPPNYVIEALKDLAIGDYIVRKSADSPTIVINFVNADQKVGEYRLSPVEEGFKEQKSKETYPSIDDFIEGHKETLQAIKGAAAPKAAKPAFPKIKHPKAINKNALSPQKAVALLSSESEGTYLIRESEMDANVKIINYASKYGIQEFRLCPVEGGYTLYATSKHKDNIIYVDIEAFIKNHGHFLKTRLHVEVPSEGTSSTSMQ